MGAGVYDGLSTVLASKARFDFLWLSSFSTSAALGLPDVGLLDVSNVADFVTTARRITSLPLVVDMESGYGDSVRVHYAAAALARAGATAVCLEDNCLSRRSSLYEGYARTLVSAREHAARIASAKRAVAGEDTIVIARTEALVAGLGVSEALERCSRYVAAGADAVFVQCVSGDGPDELLTFLNAWSSRAPVFVAPTRYEHVDRSVFHAAGATHYIFANQALRAAHNAIVTTYRCLVEDGVGVSPTIALSGISEIAADVGEGDVRTIEQVVDVDLPARH